MKRLGRLGCAFLLSILTTCGEGGTNGQANDQATGGDFQTATGTTVTLNNTQMNDRGETTTGGTQDPAAFLNLSGFHPVACPSNCPSNTTETNNAESQLRTLINDYRVSQGLAPVTWTTQLNAAARGYTKDRIIDGDHLNLQAHGINVLNRLSLLGIGSNGAGEALYSGGTSGQGIFDALKNSSAGPILLNSAATTGGVGTGFMPQVSQTSVTSVIMNR